MARKRKAVGQIRTAEQLRALASPAAVEVLEALQTGGEATVAELGPRLGRSPNSLQYHVRKLKGLGLIVQVDSRRSGARSEAVYAAMARLIEGRTLHRSSKMQRLTNDAVAAFLRMSARNFARATENGRGIQEDGRHRNIYAARRKAWLTKTQVVELNGHLEAINRLFSAGNGAQRGELCALTMVLTPLPHSSE